MKNRPPAPVRTIGSARIFRTGTRDALRIRHSPTGDVGLLFAGEGLEAVWVSKASEKIDRGWFRYPRTDLLVVLKGRLKVEFQQSPNRPRILKPGDVLVLPPRMACRAYRWPRAAPRPTVFVAVYRTDGPPSNSRGAPRHRTIRDRAHSR